MLDFRDTGNGAFDVYDGPAHVGRVSDRSGVGKFFPIRDLTFLTANQMREIVDKLRELEDTRLTTPTGEADEMGMQTGHPSVRH